MKIKTQVEHCPGSSLCAPKCLESWPYIEIFAPVFPGSREGLHHSLEACQQAMT